MTANKFLGICFISAIGFQLMTNIESSAKHVDILNDSNIKWEDVYFTDYVKPENVIHNKKPKRYKLSKKGKDFIKSHEDCKLHAYNDPDKNRRSVGWGHQIQPGENLEHISKKKADELFEKDIEWVNDAINRLISKHDNRFVYSQGFIDGLGDLIYNCGERGVTLTEFWNKKKKCRYDFYSQNYINKNDFNYTIAAVKTSRISAKGHITRRYNTHKIMLSI